MLAWNTPCARTGLWAVWNIYTRVFLTLCRCCGVCFSAFHAPEPSCVASSIRCRCIPLRRPVASRCQDSSSVSTRPHLNFKSSASVPDVSRRCRCTCGAPVHVASAQGHSHGHARAAEHALFNQCEWLQQDMGRWPPRCLQYGWLQPYACMQGAMHGPHTHDSISSRAVQLVEYGHLARIRCEPVLNIQCSARLPGEFTG